MVKNRCFRVFVLLNYNEAPEVYFAPNLVEIGPIAKMELESQRIPLVWTQFSSIFVISGSRCDNVQQPKKQTVLMAHEEESLSVSITKILLH